MRMRTTLRRRSADGCKAGRRARLLLLRGVRCCRASTRPLRVISSMHNTTSVRNISSVRDIIELRKQPVTRRIRVLRATHNSEPLILNYPLHTKRLVTLKVPTTRRNVYFRRQTYVLRGGQHGMNKENYQQVGFTSNVTWKTS